MEFTIDNQRTHGKAMNNGLEHSNARALSEHEVLLDKRPVLLLNPTPDFRNYANYRRNASPKRDPVFILQNQSNNNTADIGLRTESSRYRYSSPVTVLSQVSSAPVILDNTASSEDTQQIRKMSTPMTFQQRSGAAAAHNNSSGVILPSSNSTAFLRSCSTEENNSRTFSLHNTTGSIPNSSSIRNYASQASASASFRRLLPEFRNVFGQHAKSSTTRSLSAFTSSDYAVPGSDDNSVVAPVGKKNVTAEAKSNNISAKQVPKESLSAANSSSSKGSRKTVNNKSLKYTCKVKGCTKWMRRGGLCFSHGGGRTCSVPSCNKSVQHNGKCFAHSESISRCKAKKCFRIVMLPKKFCDLHE